MKAWWARFDTLWLRLFVLLWAALVVSHLVAFTVVRGAWMPGARAPALASGTAPGGLAGPPRPDGGAPPDAAPRPPPGLPPLTSLPPGSIWGDRPERVAATDDLGAALWVDYAIRFALLGVFAALGARWLAQPMRRLAEGSRALEHSLGRPGPVPQVDESRGPVEVRASATVFNAMARRLHEQFASRTLFMAAISHDLRTPLARLRMRLEAWRQDAASGRDIDAGVADLHEMDALIEGVLGALRNERAAEPPQAIDLHALLQALADDAADQGHDVHFDGQPPAVVQGQLLALRRIVGNLLANAIRHAGQAQLRLRIEGGHACITVDDHGPGIAEAQLEAVFEPFYRIDTARTRGATSGAGLGLYIARELACRQGGTLALCNRPEGGLRATLHLPLA